MRPLRLHARNYGPYRDVAFDVPDGVTAILGRTDSGDGVLSNGAGKTKLLEILPLALFGPRLSWSDYIGIGDAEGDLEVGVEFEYAGRRYRVRRRYSGKGRGKTALDLEVWQPPEGGQQ